MLSLRPLLAALVLTACLAPRPGWADAPNPSFYLVNRSAQAINEAYASPVNASNWGRDRLGDGTVASGGNAAVRLLADGTCVFDLRVVYEDGHADERRRVNTCTVDTISFGAPDPVPTGNPAHDPSFRIVNRGRREVDEVYARSAGSRSWGADRLGDATIDADSYRVIQLPAGQCMWDVRLVFDDGPPLERRRINLCDVTDFPVE